MGDRALNAQRIDEGQHNPFLSRLRRSETMDEAELAALGDLLMASRPVDARTDLLAEGKRVARLHVLLDGWACRYKVLADGSRQITAVLLPGDVCDLDGLYVGRADDTVGTLGPCTVAALDRAALLHLAERHPGVARALGWLGAVENTTLAEQAVSLGRRSARMRVAHLLCELFVRLAATEQAGVDGFTLPLTQADLSDLLGLSTVHVNRVLQGLRRDGLITLTGRELVIPHWPQLCAAAEFRPGYLHLGTVDAAHGPAFPAGAGAGVVAGVAAG